MKLEEITDVKSSKNKQSSIHYILDFVKYGVLPMTFGGYIGYQFGETVLGAIVGGVVGVSWQEGSSNFNIDDDPIDPSDHI